MMTDRRIDWCVHLPGNYTRAEWNQAHEQVRRICGALASPDDVVVDVVPHGIGFDVWGHWSDPTSTVPLQPVSPATEQLDRALAELRTLRTRLVEEAS